MESYQQLAKIAQQHGSPFYLFDETAFTRNFRELQGAFLQHYPFVTLGYSYKTNYIPYLCQLVRSLGGYAEVVSRLELELALTLGCPAPEIIYNGPVKTADDIAFALNSGVLVNIDTLRELEFAVCHAKEHADKPIRIGLRINIPLIDSQGHSHLQNELPSGRFGFSDNALQIAARQIRETPNLRIASLHGHTSSCSRSLWVYQTIAARLAEVGAEYFPETIESLNIGGGFYGRSAAAMGIEAPPCFDDYAGAICEELYRHPWVVARKPYIVIEPGMALSADTMSYITRVFEIKESGDQQLAVVDGTIFNVKPTLHQRNHPFALIKRGGETSRKGCYSIVGATCMEKDRLLQKVEGVEIERDDFVRIENVGAYTVVLTPPFIHPAPPILVRNADGYRAIRRRQDFNDIFGSYLF